MAGLLFYLRLGMDLNPFLIKQEIISKSLSFYCPLRWSYILVLLVRRSVILTIWWSCVRILSKLIHWFLSHIKTLVVLLLSPTLFVLLISSNIILIWGSHCLTELLFLLTLVIFPTLLFILLLSSFIWSGIIRLSFKDLISDFLFLYFPICFLLEHFSHMFTFLFIFSNYIFIQFFLCWELSP